MGRASVCRPGFVFHELLAERGPLALRPRPHRHLLPWDLNDNDGPSLLYCLDIGKARRGAIMVLTNFNGAGIGFGKLPI